MRSRGKKSKKDGTSSAFSLASTMLFSSTGIDTTHSFKETILEGADFCSSCRKPLWRKGEKVLECKNCGIHVHSECEKKASPLCSYNREPLEPVVHEPIGDLQIDGLEKKRRKGATDAYCMVKVYGNVDEVRTKTRVDSTEPVWSESFMFTLYDMNSEVTVDVYREEKNSRDEFMGRAFFSIEKYLESDGEMFDEPLRDWTGTYDGNRVGKVKLWVKPSLNRVALDTVVDQYSKLLEHMSEPDHKFIRAVCRSLFATDTIAVCLYKLTDYIMIRDLIDDEIEKTTDEETLFRSNTWSTKMARELFRQHGKSYLQEALLGPIAEIMENCESVEIDPERITGGNKKSKIENNLENVERMTRNVLESLFLNEEYLSVHIRTVLAMVKMAVSKKFGTENSTVIVGTFFFLRFVVPALVSPDLNGMIIERPNMAERRALMLVGKIVQAISNMVVFGSKEGYLQPLNKLVEEMFTPVKNFLNSVTQLPKGIARNRTILQLTPTYGAPIEPQAVFILHNFIVKNVKEIKRQNEDFSYDPPYDE